MLDLPAEIVVLDTEYTAWKGSLARDWSGPGEHREIVEIGAVLVETANFTELDTFRGLVRPLKNPKLSEYFIKLTGITQELVDRDGVDFPSAVRRFGAWSGGRPIYVWGGDWDVVLENCGLYGIPCPLREPFRDIRDVFRRFDVAVDGLMSSTVLAAFGKESPHRAHQGTNDARSIVDGLKELARVVASRS